jgi:nucleoside-diphosphate-sugar epimerase
VPSALVTGASGFVGSHLADLLVERGWKTGLLVRRSSKLRWLDARGADRVDVDFDRLAPLPPCDVVFHVAGTIKGGSLEEYREGNRDLALRVYDAARSARFVHVSSLAAAGPAERCDEETPAAPISMYGRSKEEGERALRERGGRIPLTIVRPPVVYGPRDWGLYDLYRAVARGIRPVIGGPKTISLVHVRDLCEGIVAAAESPAAAGELFYLAHPEPRTTGDVLRAVERALGVNAVPLAVPDGLVRFLGLVAEGGARLVGKRPMFGKDKALEMTQPYWCCSPAKAERVLGWRARIALEEGLRGTLDWYRREGFLPSGSALLT